MREISLSLMVYAGARAPIRGIYEMTASKLEIVTGTIGTQLRTTWHSFFLSSDTVNERQGVDYTFRFSIEAAPFVLVNRWYDNGDAYHEQSEPGTQSVREAFLSARNEGYENIAVVYPYLLRQNAPRLDDFGRWRGTRSRPTREHPDVLEVAANMMSVDYRRLIESGNGTASHETGHLMGMHDRNYDPLGIMRSSTETLNRYMTASDQLGLHHAVEQVERGRIWDGVRLTRPGRRRARRRGGILRR